MARAVGVHLVCGIKIAARGMDCDPCWIGRLGYRQLGEPARGTIHLEEVNAFAVSWAALAAFAGIGAGISKYLVALRCSCEAERGLHDRTVYSKCRRDLQQLAARERVL